MNATLCPSRFDGGPANINFIYLQIFYEFYNHTESVQIIFRIISIKEQKHIFNGRLNVRDLNGKCDSVSSTQY